MINVTDPKSNEFRLMIGKETVDWGLKFRIKSKNHTDISFVFLLVHKSKEVYTIPTSKNQR